MYLTYCVHLVGTKKTKLPARLHEVGNFKIIPLYLNLYQERLKPFLYRRTLSTTHNEWLHLENYELQKLFYLSIHSAIHVYSVV
jgi:hypothetical protein